MKSFNLKKENSQNERGDATYYDYLFELTTVFLTGKH